MSKPDIKLLKHIHANQKVFEPFLTFLCENMLEQSGKMSRAQEEVAMRWLQGRNQQLDILIDILTNTASNIDKLDKR
jgi:hypothetical protein